MSAPELGRLLGSGKEAEVFAAGELVLKLYRSPASKSSAFREAAILAIVEASGLPAPIVLGVRQVDGRWGLEMTRAAGEPLGDMMLREPARIAAGIDEMVKLHRRIHSRPGAGLTSLRQRLSHNIGKAGALLGPARQARLLDALAALPEGDRLCHGDFHPWNILQSGEQATIVDWLDATSGAPAADVCRSHVLMHPARPDLAAAYVNAYVASGGASVQEIFAWLPVVAAARLAENVPDETDRLMEMVGAG